MNSGTIVLASTVTGAALATAKSACELVVEYAKRRMLTRASVDSRDDAYTWLIQWLASHPSQHRGRKVTISSSLKMFGTGGFEGFRRPQLDDKRDTSSEKVWLLPGMGEHLVWFQGRCIWFSRYPVQTSESSSFFASRMAREELHITVLGDRKILEDLVAEAKAQYKAAVRERTVVYSVQDGYWERVGSRIIRPLSTVVLPENQARTVLADCEEFLESEQWYSINGIPYRRGYLLYGPPGTGKTSLVTALAGELQLDVYVVTLSSPSMTDEILRSLLNSAGARSILLLEDVDAAFVGRAASDDQAPRLTFSGLLNAIDGVAAQEGRLLFMTTNHIDRLSSALIRPGRIDVRVQFVLATAPQIRALFFSFYNSVPKRSLATSQASGVLPVAVTATTDAATPPASPTAIPQLPAATAAGAAAPPSVPADGADASDPAAATITGTANAKAAAVNGNDSDSETSFANQHAKGRFDSQQARGVREVAGGPGVDSARLAKLADEFAAAVPEGVVSMAQLQGYLMAHKLDPAGAVRRVGELLESCRAAAAEEGRAKEAAGAGGGDAGAQEGASKEAPKRGLVATLTATTKEGVGKEGGVGKGLAAAAVPEGVVSMAQLQGLLKAHKLDPQGAARRVGELLESCRAAAAEQGRVKEGPGGVGGGGAGAQEGAIKEGVSKAAAVEEAVKANCTTAEGGDKEGGQQEAACCV